MNGLRNIHAGILLIVFCCTLHGQSSSIESSKIEWGGNAIAPARPNEAAPALLGYAEDRFSLGPLMVQEMLDDQTQFLQMWDMPALRRGDCTSMTRVDARSGTRRNSADL
jgi:hypothetical protein